MNIILGEDVAREMAERYTVLSLDTFRVTGQSCPVKSYCLIEQVPLDEMLQMQSWKDLHENLMINYALKNWNYCEQAIEHLMGKWDGQLDSFYVDLKTRIDSLKDQVLDPDWDGLLIK